MRTFLLPIVFCYLFTIQSFGQNTSSALSEGTWFKIEIPESGIYSLSYDDLKAAGVSVNSVVPQQIAVYGNGGGMLPQLNSIPRHNDLVENSIKVTGEEDGSFDPGDKVVFYAEGPHSWTADQEAQVFLHHFNIYSDVNYYFLRTDKTGGGKRVEEVSNEGTGQIITSYNERAFHEKDEYNLMKTGRLWLGDLFDTELNKTFNFPVPDISGDSFNLKFAVVARSAKLADTHPDSKPFMDISVNSKQLERINFSTNVIIKQNHFKPVKDYRVINTSLSTDLVANGLIAVNMVYDKNGVDTPNRDLFVYGGYVDFIELNYTRKLELRENQTPFRSFKTVNSDLNTFKFKNTYENLIVWDITNPLNPVNCTIKSEGDSTSITTSGNELKELIAFNGYVQKRAAKIKKITNQDIHGAPTPDFIIVTSKIFQSEAERLAELHRSHDQMDVLVVTTEKVYNEFSSGKQDITAIRDLCRYFYNREDGKLKHLLLFGHSSYDYKDRIEDNANYVPTYQSRDSFHSINSYASDDYFAFMEESEGEWIENSSGNHTMDISVGRFPVKTIDEASAAVNKTIDYCLNPKAVGEWRSKILFFADEFDRNIHLDDCEIHSDYIEKNHPEVNIQKLYIDAYSIDYKDGKEFCEEFDNDMRKAFNDGVLVFNYVGHGGTRDLSHRLNKDMVDSWDNQNNLPFFITASCEFSRFDNPHIFSLGSYIVVKPNGGGIGVLSGSRPAYSTANELINSQILRNIFKPELRMGDVIRLAKNKSFSTVNNRHFILLGDPAVRLKIPENKVRLTKVNETTAERLDTLKALSHVILEGEVTNPLNSRLNQFTGLLDITLFDKAQTNYTLGRVDPNNSNNKSYKTDYEERVEVLFKGRTKVENGKFSIDFVLPIQAADSIGSSKISMYAFTSDGRDALGVYDSLWTGEIDRSAPQDVTPPEILVYMDTVTFTSGDSVLSDSYLKAKLFDESGINLASLDQENLLLAVLNEDSNIVVNSYYTTDTSDFKNGKVEYQFENLPEGPYTLALYASDVYNNRSSQLIDFIVGDNITGINHPGLSKFLKANAYPNPFSNNTTIEIDGVNSSQASVTISDMSGKVVKELKDVYFSENNGIKWDGTDQSGAKLSKGMYICKIYLEDKNQQYSLMLLIQ